MSGTYLEGLSPRGRGNRQRVRPERRLGRSIPAWAGQPRTASVWTPSGPVYPRVGGATPLFGRRRLTEKGLSPRGRGNRSVGREPQLLSRSIPAWAGQPGSFRPTPYRARVYPRVGGATGQQVRLVVQEQGLSPRGRGNRPAGPLGSPRAGSIPAWAGQPYRFKAVRRSIRVYPRVGGATIATLRLSSQACGLSPRGRGNLRYCAEEVAQIRSIPAWAGQPRLCRRPAALVSVYPRVGGATTLIPVHSADYDGLSPRGRGNQAPIKDILVAARSIPAWAGQPKLDIVHRSEAKVYPRVGGATAIAALDSGTQEGLSPRGRGNLSKPAVTVATLRSIPAWAGQPL